MRRGRSSRRRPGHRLPPSIGEDLDDRVVQLRRHRIDRQVLRSVAGHGHLPRSGGARHDPPIGCHEARATAPRPGVEDEDGLRGFALHRRHDTTPAVWAW